MSCYGCANKFSFFQKESPCASCGFGFCGRCLKNKITLANETKPSFVCNVCFKMRTNGLPTADSGPATSSILKTGIGQSNTDIKKSSALAMNGNFYLDQLTKLNEEDEKIAARLKKLREETRLEPESSSQSKIESRLKNLRDPNNQSTQSFSQIDARLRKLKGANSQSTNDKTIFLSDLRSEQQQVDDLLEQYVAEQEIKLVHAPESGIEARLASLRNAGIKPNSTPYLNELVDSSESDEDAQIDKLTRKIMDEVALDKSLASSSTGIESDQCETNTKKKHPRHLKHADRGVPLHASTPELSFCIICLADAKRRCLDCEGGNSIYCENCYDEIHRDWGDMDHRFIDYVPRRFHSSNDEDSDEDSDELDSDDHLDDKIQYKNV